MKTKLNQLLADTAVLSKKVQNYHWNIVGKGFFSVHSKLDEVYENLNDVMDEVAERLLALEGRPLSNFKSYLEVSKIKEADNVEITIDSAISSLVEDFTYYVAVVKEVKEVADENSDYGTSAMMDEILLNTEKLLWMLRVFTK